MHASECGHSVPISIGLEILRADIDICERKDRDTVNFGLLDRPDDFSENLNCIVLLFSLRVDLSRNVQLLIIKNGGVNFWEKFYRARLEIRLDPQLDAPQNVF